MLALSLELKELYDLLFWLRLKAVVEPRAILRATVGIRINHSEHSPTLSPKHINQYLYSIYGWTPTLGNGVPLTKVEHSDTLVPAQHTVISYAKNQGNQISFLHVGGPML